MSSISYLQSGNRGMNMTTTKDAMLKKADGVRIQYLKMMKENAR